MAEARQRTGSGRAVGPLDRTLRGPGLPRNRGAMPAGLRRARESRARRAHRCHQRRRLPEPLGASQVGITPLPSSAGGQPADVLALEAARRAGEIILQRFQDPHVLEYKAKRNFVTDVDKEAEAAILSLLRSDFPEH